MSDLELLEEAFALTWEVDVPASPSYRDREVSSSGVEINQVVRAFALVWFLWSESSLPLRWC
jgi:hypothetical protein